MEYSEKNCCHCGKEFKKDKKGYSRRSLYAGFSKNLKGKTVKDIVEEELTQSQLTPESKTTSTKFFCTECYNTLRSVASSSSTKHAAIKRLKELGGNTGYLSSKISSPFVSPRRKKKRINSPLSSKSSSSKEEIIEQDVKSQPSYLLKVKNAAPYVKKRRYVYRKKLIKEDSIAQAFLLFKTHRYKKALNIFLKTRVGFAKAVKNHFSNTIRNEVRSTNWKKMGSFKGQKTLEEMNVFDWKVVIAEVAENCPMLLSALESALLSKHHQQVKETVNVQPLIGTIMSLILYEKNSRFSWLQEHNSLQMWMAGCKRQLFTYFNHLNLCTGIKGARAAIDRIRTGYDKEVMNWRDTVTDYMSTATDYSVGSSATIPYVEDSDNGNSNGNEKMEVSPVPSLIGYDIERPKHDGIFGYSLCFDNVNHHLKTRHYTRDSKSKMLNMVQAYAARDRVKCNHLSDESPPHQDIIDIPMKDLLPTEEDECLLRDEMKVMVKRVLVNHVPIFKKLENDIVQNIPNVYTKESSSKSNMVPLGVIDKDETKTGDTIEIIEDYQKYVPFKSDGNPLQLPLHADGLSCERGHDAQNARINSTNKWSQLQGLTLNIQEWHKRCLLLQDIYDDLFKPTSSREVGTLYQLKNYFNHRSVKVNVKDAFNENEEFLDFCCNGYLVLAALNFLEDDSVTDIDMDANDCLTVLDNVADRIVKDVFVPSHNLVDKILSEDAVDDEYEYCICKVDIPGANMIFCENKKCDRGNWFHFECVGITENDVTEESWYCSPECENFKGVNKRRGITDGKRIYAMNVMWAGLNQKVRRDAIRENDGIRMILHWKFDMLNFEEHHHPKYFLIGHRLLMAVNGAASPRLRHALIWNRTVNVHGGVGNNISMDLQMEFYNRLYKESIKDAGGNLTPETIARHSQMVGVGDILRTLYAKNITLKQQKVHQSHKRVEREKDLSEFVRLLKKENVFKSKPGRHHKSFKNISLNRYENVSAKKVKAKLNRLQKSMSINMEVSDQMLHC